MSKCFNSEHVCKNSKAILEMLELQLLQFLYFNFITCLTNRILASVQVFKTYCSITQN